MVCAWVGMAVGDGACVFASVHLLRLFLFLFLPLLLVFGVVRAQPCEHARYPRTPLCSLFLLFAPLLLLLLLLLLLPAFLLRVGMAAGVVTMCLSVRWA